MKIRYKKQVVKRYEKIEKNKDRKYPIKEFNVLVEILHPKKQVINGYESLINRVEFTQTQKQLLKQTVKSFTILNELYRECDNYGRLYSIQEDVVNAVYLLQNEIGFHSPYSLLPEGLRWFYKQLQMDFSGMDFTNLQVRLKLRRSQSTVYRYLTQLVDRDLVEIVGKSRCAYVYRIKEK